MKIYIPMKPHKWGFKIHLLCDSNTNYLYNILFDPGKEGKDSIIYENNPSISQSIVLRLLSCINDGKKRNIFFDGWYSSIELMNKLTKLGYLNTTIFRNNEKDLPSKIKEEGYNNAYKDNVLIQKHQDKKAILFGSNYKILSDDIKNIYNVKNRGVDVFDQYLGICTIQRTPKKWYKKVLLFGVNAAIINAKIISYIRYGKETTTLQFKERIIKYIFEKYKKLVSNDFNNINEENKIINNTIEDNYIIHNLDKKYII